jgi:hypothetical protein
MKTLLFLKSILLQCIAILFILTLGCSTDPVQPQLTETEKKLTANSWHGVWQLSQLPYPQVTLLYEELTFKSDKSCSSKECNVATTHNWSVTDSANISYLSLSNIRYAIGKLTADTLVLLEQPTGKSYLFLKTFKGYNRVKIRRTYANGTMGGTLGLGCATLENSEIPDYKFNAITSPNPVSSVVTLAIQIGNSEASLKITLDDGQSQVRNIFDGIIAQGNYTMATELTEFKSGVYRISYTVKPLNGATSKTVYSYLFVFR